MTQTEMSRVIFINRFYWPDEPATSQLLTDLAEQLAAHNLEVLVITSKPQREDRPATEQHHGVTILRVGSSHLGKANSISRVLDFTSFMFGALWRMFRVTRRADTVVFMTDPPLLGALGWPLVALRRARFIHWIQDIYPEIAIELTGHRWLACLKPLRNWSWRKASCCVTLGTDMAKVVATAGVPEARMKIIPNWAPSGLKSPSAQEIDLRKHDWSLVGKFVALYSGNLGRVHDLQPIIETAALLKHEKDIAFVFVGQGVQLAALRTFVRQRNLTNVHFFPPQPREQLAVTLAQGDVHFVTLRQNCERYVFPSKLYGIVAEGKPTIFIGPLTSELADLVRKENLGYSFEPDQIHEIGAALIHLRDDPEDHRRLCQAAGAFAQNNNLPHALQSWLILIGTEEDLAVPQPMSQSHR